MKKYLLVVAICIISTSVYAAKPDWAGKGKPDRTDVQDMVESLKDTDGRKSDILDRVKPGKGKKPKPKDRKDKDENDDENDDHDMDDDIECELSKEECAALRAERKAQRDAMKAERKLEREAARAERDALKTERELERETARAERPNGKPESAGNRPENRGRAGQQNAGLEQQAEEKLAAEQKELNKGSEKGIETRATKSKKWWQFWK